MHLPNHLLSWDYRTLEQVLDHGVRVHWIGAPLASRARELLV